MKGNRNNHPNRHPDPTPAELVAYMERIRDSWSEDERIMRGNAYAANRRSFGRRYVRSTGKTFTGRIMRKAGGSG